MTSKKIDTVYYLILTDSRFSFFWYDMRRKLVDVYGKIYQLHFQGKTI
jgi:hypothetical protein